jgi:hypothetical protein
MRAVMNTVRNGYSELAELEQSFKDLIAQRTGRGVRALEVELIGDRVVVRGSTTSYYLKQLAQQAALDLIAQAGVNVVECNIEVRTSSPILAESVE